MVSTRSSVLTVGSSILRTRTMIFLIRTMISLHLLATLPTTSQAFLEVISEYTSRFPPPHQSLFFHPACTSRTTTTTASPYRRTNPRSMVVIGLPMANIKISTPSSEEAADMGIREWPSQPLKRKGRQWTEFVSTDQTVVRYILDGSGTLISTDDDNARTKTTPLQPGTLVEVKGTASLEWTVNEDMIVLTPGVEDRGLLLGVAVIIATIFGVLLSGGIF